MADERAHHSIPVLVGDRFNGKYYVTQVVHEWTTEQGLQTKFSASGRRDRGIWSMIQDTRPRALGMNTVIGIVTNNKNPEEMGRVRVKYPWLSDSDESAWAVFGPLFKTLRCARFIAARNEAPTGSSPR